MFGYPCTTMALTTSRAFSEFIRNISLTDAQAAVAEGRRSRIVELLGDTFNILDSFPTGSMIRGTALRCISDLDIFVVLHYGKHIQSKTPRAVLESVRDALSEYRNHLTKKNGQAVTLYFDAPPNDLPPGS